MARGDLAIPGRERITRAGAIRDTVRIGARRIHDEDPIVVLVVADGLECDLSAVGRPTRFSVVAGERELSLAHSHKDVAGGEDDVSAPNVAVAAERDVGVGTAGGRPGEI